MFFYRDLLISELVNYSSHIHIVGYSLGGILAYELAQSLEKTSLCCASLCLVDPAPFCRSSLVPPKPDYLTGRASTYDIVLKGLLNKDTSFGQAVMLNDITSMGDLER